MKIITKQLTTKLTLIIIGLTAGSALLVPATYASFHPVTSNEIADGTILSRDIRDGQVGSIDIGTGQVASVDIQDRTIRRGDVVAGALSPSIVFSVSDSEEIPAGERGDESVLCPSGYRATGGGFAAGSPGLQVLDSFPVVTDMVNDGPPVGWRARAEASTAADEQLWATVICIGPIPP